MEKLLTSEYWIHANRKKWIIWGWGYALPLIVLVVLTIKFEASLSKLLNVTFNVTSIGFLIAVLMLLPINLLIESFKWKKMVESSRPTSLLNCFKIIISGKSLNMISPFGLGDGVIRFLPFAKGQKTQGTVLILLDRLTKTLPTYLFGIWSASYLIWNGMNVRSSILLTGVAILLIVLFFLFLVAQRRQWSLRWDKFKVSFISIGGSNLGYFTFLSILRYFVFSIQFYLIFQWLEVQTEATVLFLGIFWIFFMKSLLPSITLLTDLAVRELSALTFFSFLSVPVEPVIFGTFLIWVINILLPSTLGLFFINDSKRYLT